MTLNIRFAVKRFGIFPPSRTRGYCWIMGSSPDLAKWVTALCHPFLP
jgi:hypothetical protein